MCGVRAREHLMFSLGVPKHHTLLLTQPADVLFKDAAPTITSATSISPDRRRVQRNHIQQTRAGYNNAVIYATRRFNEGTDSQKTRLC